MHSEEQPVHPQTRRHLLNNERLRHSAIREFSLHGLTGAKVSNIVGNAQLTQPSFYRMWPSKEAAYQRIIEQTVEEWQTVATGIFTNTALWTTGSLLSQIEQSIFSIYQALTVNLDLTALVLKHQHQYPGHRESYLDIYTRGFAGLQQRRMIACDLPAETLGQTYLALTERFFQARLLHGQASAWSAAHEVAPLFLGILQSRLPTHSGGRCRNTAETVTT